MDRCALVACGTLVGGALAWVAFHPVAAGILQVLTVGLCLVWRMRLRHMAVTAL